MSKEVDIIRKAAGWVWGPERGSPLEEMETREEILAFFQRYRFALARPVIAAFHETYPPDIPDEEIPEADKELFMAAWDAAAEASSKS